MAIGISPVPILGNWEFGLLAGLFQGQGKVASLGHKKSLSIAEEAS